MTPPQSPSTELTVDLAAYRSNLALLRATVAPATVMAVVKADAYGHGLVPMARVAVRSGIAWLGSLDTETALELRAAGVGTETSIFAWHLAPHEDYRSVIDAQIDLGSRQSSSLSKSQLRAPVEPLELHLKIDTGLHRNGALAADWPKLVSRALELQRDKIVDVFGVWTHIAEASDEEDSLSIARFIDAIGVAEALGARFRVRHLAASAAGFARRDSRFDLVRFGAFGYGISPGDGVTAAELLLIPVMTLSTTTVTAGDGTVVVPLGYGDGISSRAAGRVQLAVNGVLRTVAEVGVDRLVVQGDGLREGARVVLFGTGSEGEWTLQQWADSTGTIGEEVVTRLSATIRRSYLDA